MGPGLVGQEGLLVELAGEAIGELPQPAGVELSGRLHRPLLHLRSRLGAHTLCCPSDHRRLAEAELTVGKRFGHHRQLGQLAGDLDPLRRRPSRQPCVLLQPGDRVQCPAGLKSTRCIKARQPSAEVGLEPVDGPALLAQRRAQLGTGEGLEILGLKRPQPPSIAERMFVFYHILV